MRHAENGLTLIELLAVMTIMCVLGYLGFVAFAKVRDSMDRASSVNQLKSIYSAIVAYSIDHNGRIPSIALFDDEGEPLGGDDRFFLPDGRVDIPYLLTDYINQRVFLSPKNKKYKDFGYYDNRMGTSYIYRGFAQRLDGQTHEGEDFPLSSLYLMSEIRNWHNGKAHHLLGNGQIVLE